MLRCYLVKPANILDLFPYGFPGLRKGAANCSYVLAAIVALQWRAEADGLAEVWNGLERVLTL